MAHLKRHLPEASLREATFQLFKTRRDGDGSYEWVDGEWLSAELASTLDPLDAEGPAAAAFLKDLRAELLMLRASHKALKERVVDVERRTRVSEVPEDIEVEAQGRAVPEGQAESAPDLAARDQALGASEDGDLEEDSKAFARACLPTANAVFASLKQLLGSEPALEFTANDPVPSRNTIATLQVSLLTDESGRELGAVLANSRAIAELGGALLGFPTESIEQYASKGPSEDLLLAMSEICNSLGSAVNRASGDVRVRAEPVGPAPLERIEWLAAAAKGHTLAGSSGAKLWLYTR